MDGQLLAFQEFLPKWRGLTKLVLGSGIHGLQTNFVETLQRPVESKVDLGIPTS